MQFSNQGELAGSVRFYNAPRLLLAFVAISALAHGVTLFFSSEPLLSPPTTKFGATFISTILSPADKETVAVSEKNTPRQKIQKEELRKIRPTEKNSGENITPTKTPQKIVSRTAATEPVEKQTTRTGSASEKNKWNGSPSKTITSLAEQSLAAKKSEQRNYLLGELQNRLSKYLTYPLRARRRGWQGEVMVAFHIDERGKLGNVRLAHSSGYSLLDRSAVNAIAKLDEITLPHAMGPMQAMELQLPVRYQLRES